MSSRVIIPNLLFAYGTLGPVDHDAAVRDGWSRDAVRGRLFDLGPYPALVDLEQPGTGWIEGYTRTVSNDELIQKLDPYEGVGEGIYRRESARARSGRPVWVYVYARPIPARARECATRWERSKA